MADLTKADLDFLALLLRDGPQKFSADKSAAAKLKLRGFITHKRGVVSLTPAGRFAATQGAAHV